MYEYHALVRKVVDGDTMRLQVDPGLDLRVNLTVRLHGVNAPEMSTQAGKDAKAWVASWLATQAPDGFVVLNTIKDRHEKYGRYLGIIRSIVSPQAPSLNDALVTAGQAVPYMVT